MEIVFPDQTVTEESIVRYMDIHGLFEDVILTARKYQQINMIESSEQKDLLMPWRFTIEINVLDLAEINDEASNLLLGEPQLFSKLVEKVVHCAVNTALDLEIDLKIIRISLRVNLPSLSESVSSSASHLLPGLFVVRGVLIALTTLSKYIRSELYHCPIIECVCGGGRERVDGDWENCQSRCDFTDFPKVKIPAAQEIGDQTLAVIIDTAALSLDYGVSRGITVYFRDDLATELELGSCYQLTVTRGRLGGTSKNLLAWGVQELLPEPKNRLLSGLRLLQFPNSIQRLAQTLSERCSESSWALTAALFCQLAHNLAPMNCFLHLKAGILLSLASQCLKREQQPCHVMCLGLDGMPLVYHCARQARRIVAPSTWPAHHPAGLYRNDVQTGCVWMEAGTLLLASSGVCLLGDWHAYEKQRTSEIFLALENGEVSLDTQEYKCDSMPAARPLEAAVWAVYSRKCNPAKTSVVADKALRTVIELFGMPFIGSCESMQEIEDLTMFKLAENAINCEFNPERDLLVPEKDLRELLDIVSSRSVRISERARSLLQCYFVAVRNSRPGCLPAAAIKIMTALSEAHARLSLRDEVMECDSLFVIRLYEEAMSHIYGPSSILTNCDPHRPNNSNPISIAEQTHENMIKFSLSVESNLKNTRKELGTSNSSSNYSEE